MKTAGASLTKRIRFRNHKKLNRSRTSSLHHFSAKSNKWISLVVHFQQAKYSRWVFVTLVGIGFKKLLNRRLDQKKRKKEKKGYERRFRVSVRDNLTLLNVHEKSINSIFL